MKTNILAMCAASAIALGFAACSDDTWNPQINKEGMLRLNSLSLNVDTDLLTVSRASESDLVDPANFLVSITGTDVEKNYVYSEMPEIVTLPAGNYSVSVRSHEVQKADWDAPYFVGSANFSITENKITDIGTVTCKFKSIKVSIKFSDELLKHLGTDYKVTVVANDEGTLVFNPGETRSAYFEAVAESTTLAATFTGSVDGNFNTIAKSYTGVTAGTHYIITYSVSKYPPLPDEQGTLSVSGISVDTDIVSEDVDGNIVIDEDTTDDNDRPGQEGEEQGGEPENPEEPGSENITFTSGDALDLENVNMVTEEEYGKLIVNSVYGFKHFYVTISTDSPDFAEALPSVGMPTHFDLVNPKDENEAAVMKGFGFPTGSDFDGLKEINFNISSLVPLLGIYAGNHTFVIKVVDNQDESNSLTLKFKSE